MSDTPRSDEKAFASTWPISWNRSESGQVVDLEFAQELEREASGMRDLAFRLYQQLLDFDCDDSGQDLKREARIKLVLS
jgi:hypothetical protein